MIRVRCALVGSIAIFSLLTCAASASESVAPGSTEPAPSPPESAEVAKLGRVLQVSATESHKARRAFIFTGIVMAAALVPAGVELWKRSDPVSHSIGSTVTIGGAAPLSLTLLSLSRSPLERLDASFEQRRASGMDGKQLVALTEEDWQTAAEVNHDRRIISGIVEVALGASATGAGLSLLLARPLHGLSRNQQYTIGSLLVGPGVPILTLGIHSLLVESSVESSWVQYRESKDAPHGSASVWSSLSTSFAMINGGPFVNLAMSL